MKSNYKRLGDYIRQIDVRNRDLRTNNLLGINIDKFFMPSVANIIGTDLKNYKLIKKNQFACNPMHVGRDERLPVALYLTEDESIVSPAYYVFEVTNEDLLSEYLMLWFRRPEFDRECFFYTDASVRGGIAWEDFCDMKLPVPPIEEQQKIVDAYKKIENRIALKKKIIGNLETQAQSIFYLYFGAYYSKNVLPKGWSYIKLGDICSIKGGKRLPIDCELTDTHTNHPYIRVRDIGYGRYVCLNNQFQYIDDYTHNKISRYIVYTNDIVISIVGTIGLIGKIHVSLNGANLTENCVRLTDIRNITSDYLYYTLLYKKQIKEIDLLSVGAVQAKLPIYNIQSMSLILPPKDYLATFQSVISVINQQVERNTIEIQILEMLKFSILTTLSR